MKQKLFAVSLAAVLLLAGCGGGSSMSNGAAAGGDMPASSSISGGGWGENESWAEEDSWDQAMPEPEAPMDPGQGSTVYQRPDAKLIRRATLEIQTEQFDQSLEALNKLVDSCEGYFENSVLYSGGRLDAYASRNGEYVIRVPAEKYNQFLASAGNLGYVTHKNESTEDVGERYYDTEARLKTQRTKRDRLLALLEKAESIEDIIQLESALSDVEYQIEQYSSELNRYDALIGFSTFNVYLYEVGRVTQEVGETSSLGARMAAGFQASVRNLGEGFQDFLVWASYNIFLLAVLAAAAAAALVVGKRELKKLKKQDTEQGPAETK